MYYIYANKTHTKGKRNRIVENNQVHVDKNYEGKHRTLNRDTNKQKILKTALTKYSKNSGKKLPKF